MRKIYNYILSAFFISSLVACDGQDEEIIHMQNQDPVVTVTSISDAVGYVGNEFTIYGTNFGIVANDVEVYVGNTKLQLISCEDEELTVKIPEGATAGRISVVVYGQRVDTQLMYDVLGVPGIRTVIPLYGFVGDEIKFNGHDLGVPSAHYKVLFSGKEESAAFMAEPEMENFSVKVPEGAQSGAITLTIADVPVNVSGQFTVLQHATVDKVQNTAGEDSNQGLAGCISVITGTNLKPELLESDIELPGTWKVEFLQGTEIIATGIVDMEQLSNEKITLKVPEMLTAGNYKIAVSTPFEEIKTRLDYTILPKPIVTGISKTEGYVNAEVVISGTDFGNKASDIEVKFGETVCEVPTFDKDGNIVVRVPAGLQAGANTLTLTIQGVTISMGEYGVFEVYDTPEITSIEGAYNFPYGILVKAGSNITIKGKNFGTDANAIVVMLGEEQIDINGNVTADAISITVPNDFTSGKLLMKIQDVDVDIEGPELVIMPEDGDITQYVLKNYKHEWLVMEGSDARKREWWKPQDWEVEGVSCEGKVVGVQWQDKNNAVTSLAMQSGWGCPDKMENGKIWQVTSLPVGQYDIIINVRDIKLSGQSYAMVCVGDEGILDIEDVSNSLAQTSLTKVGEVKMELNMSKCSVLSIGFVSTLTSKERYVKIESFKVILVE